MSLPGAAALARNILPTVARRSVTRRSALASGRAFSSIPSWKVELNYQEPPPPGKFTGRYINQPDKGDAVDEMKPCEAVMHDGRALATPATLESMGWELQHWPSAVGNWKDDDEVMKTYYDEIRQLIKQLSGAKSVLVFDHTIRETGATSLNASAGQAAAPVPRVHSDYTAEGAPKRLKLFAEQGVYSHIRGRNMTEAEVVELADCRYAFFNIWRPICEEPVERSPLAVCDPASVPKDDFFKYELHFPDRVGENYSLRFNEAHKWYYYPRQTKDECLVFKVYDKKEDGTRFVFHTAFADPATTESSPARRSIEVRTIAFFDCAVDNYGANPDPGFHSADSHE